MKTKIFLLGGKDLEMLCIVNLLDRCHIRYYDNHLSWDNAILSAYQDKLSKYSGKPDYEIYGIELREDIDLPSNYVRIDHHNQQDSLPSSLEQVAEILSYQLNRMERLVAANDSQYIPGMEKLGATRKEIDYIRREDRKAQGVTELDELLAERAIREQLTKCADLQIVHAFSPRFSAICDRLYPFSKLIIYTDDEWMYYGSGVSDLKEIFQDYVDKGLMFYGGGGNGYIGTVKKAFSKNELLSIVERIKQIQI